MEQGFTGRKVKGTIHWVPAPYAKKAEVRLYENLIDEEKGVYNKEGWFSEPESKFSEDYQRCYVEDKLCRCERSVTASSL